MTTLDVVGVIAAFWMGLVGFVLLFVAIAKKPTPPLPPSEDSDS